VQRYPERKVRCSSSISPERISTFWVGLLRNISRRSTLDRASDSWGDHIRSLGTETLSTRKSY
jgi:hypothetical protein